MAKKILPKVYIALWMVLLLGLGIFYAGFAPRDAEFTETENRTLAAFPEVTAESLFSGRFSQEIETYLLDRFPLRDQAIDGVNRLQSFLSFATYDEYLLIAESEKDPLVSDDYQDLLDDLLNQTDPEPEDTVATDPTTEPTVTDPTETTAETEPPEDPPIEKKPAAKLEDFPEYVGVYMDTGYGVEAVQSFHRNNVLAVTRVLNKLASCLPENGKLMFTVGPAARIVNRFVNAEQKVSFYSTCLRYPRDLQFPYYDRRLYVLPHRQPLDPLRRPQGLFSDGGTCRQGDRKLQYRFRYHRGRALPWHLLP